ncbi:glutamine amidotransferase [Cryobacterium sp. MLB-32]|nr:gamma-glutamyl-gamma-aminobutyrate hydrolase family protein [Cryobacterium sp. MLB-32]KFF60958.1 glutamine amidotransferase [Cryobacterium sp. MLB-32]
MGLTTYLQQAQTGVWDVQAAFLPAVYVQAVTRAGGIAVLLPPQPVNTAIADRVLAGLDGLIITGGRDVDPARYGAQPHPATDHPQRDRDLWETELLRRALEQDLPFLGICRGAQVLNVALGGTLHQHLPDIVGNTGYQVGGGTFTQLSVDIDPHSRLHALVGEDRLAVPVYHHQSIDRVADGLVVSAITEHGIIEAVEVTTKAFALAVQWHPEESAEDLRLFAGLVDAASTYRRAQS